jgi:hypothetical protein
MSQSITIHISELFLQIAMDRLNMIPFSQVIDNFIDYIEKLMNAESASIYFCDHVHHEIWYISNGKGYNGEYGIGVVGRVANTVKPIREKHGKILVVLMHIYLILPYTYRYTLLLACKYCMYSMYRIY